MPQGHKRRSCQGSPGRANHLRLWPFRHGLRYIGTTKTQQPLLMSLSLLSSWLLPGDIGNMTEHCRVGFSESRGEGGVQKRRGWGKRGRVSVGGANGVGLGHALSCILSCAAVRVLTLRLVRCGHP